MVGSRRVCSGLNHLHGGGLSGGLRKSTVGIKIAPPAGDF